MHRAAVPFVVEIAVASSEAAIVLLDRIPLFERREETALIGIQ